VQMDFWLRAKRCGRIGWFPRNIYMQADTGIGGPRSRFPETRPTAIRDLGSRDSAIRERALEAVFAAYWKPVYTYIRVRWSQSNEDAKDLTQSFFARALEKEFLGAYDPEKARFRTYLRVCLDAFLANESKAAHRLKRGGDAVTISLDFKPVEQECGRYEVASNDPSPEDHFRREWVRNLFTLAAEDLKRDCDQHDKRAQFEIFARYDLSDHAERPTYDGLAAEMGLSTATVTNQLAAMRRRFRHLLLARIEEATVSEQEFREEVRAVLGIET